MQLPSLPNRLPRIEPDDPPNVMARKINDMAKILTRFFKGNKTLLKDSTASASTYTVDVSDDIVFVTRTASGTCTVTLPSAVLFVGRMLTITDAGNNASSNNITISRSGSDTIKGAATSLTISTDSGAVILAPNGTDWQVMSAS